jgi:hypothetical protein
VLEGDGDGFDEARVGQALRRCSLLLRERHQGPGQRRAGATKLPFSRLHGAWTALLGLALHDPGADPLYELLRDEPESTFAEGEHMPLFARHTDKVALVRSVTHRSYNHEPSVYRTLTGRINETLAVPRNQRNRNDFPNLGSVISSFTPPGVMPAAVTIPRPIGHDGVTYSGTHAGFLGGRHDPMEVAAAEETKEHPTHSIALPAEVAETRLLARRGLPHLPC